MTLLTEPRVLWRLLRGIPRHGSATQRLEKFYAPQADAYDRTRESLLRGRRPMLELLDLPAGGHLVELGAGTGAILDLLGNRANGLGRISLVDVCTPLLAVARRRAAAMSNVTVIEADATSWRPEAPVDAVVLSYALTMIPDWFLAVDNACSMLKPGGIIGVTDFHVSRRDPPVGLVRHGFATRTFWPLWFGHDGVRPNPDHLPYLMTRFDPGVVLERKAAIPGLAGLRAPYYVFIGRRRKVPGARP